MNRRRLLRDTAALTSTLLLLAAGYAYVHQILEHAQGIR